MLKNEKLRNKVRSLFDNPIFRFLFVAGILYWIWFIFYETYLIPKTDFDYFVTKNLVEVTNSSYSLLGVQTMVDEESQHIVISLASHPGMGVWVGTPCNGLKLFALFSIFIIAYPGKWKHKLWFIPSGIFLIYWIHTMGELMVSPVGLSAVTKLAPTRIVGMTMGAWFLYSGLSNLLAGLIASTTGAETIGGQMTDVAAAKAGYIEVYTQVGYTALGISLLMLIMAPVITKMMRGAD